VAVVADLDTLLVQAVRKLEGVVVAVIHIQPEVVSVAMDNNLHKIQVSVL
jgi:hypothetical protein